MGDFATGAFAALMATPCSAPFLGTAVAYALTQEASKTLAVFLALGLGLALPYLAVALRPGWVRLLPRPGTWMNGVKLALGGLMMLAALWVLSVLWQSGGVWMAASVAALSAVLLGLLLWFDRPALVASGGLSLAVLCAALIPVTAPQSASALTEWARFSVSDIQSHVEAGDVVFVDVTAGWCLTCKANKRLVLDREPVQGALDDVVQMQADWTRPDPAISDYLAMHDRFGIPFNIVYGPSAPDGIILPELLTDAAVLDALAQAE
jgi:suppressor for copper-sensitivity B